MTEQEQNIAIAKATGWTEIEPCTCCSAVSRGLPPGATTKRHIPNYTGSLDAMHEAEKTLTDSEFEDFFDILENQVPFAKPRTKRRHVCSAEAPQRARAFLEVKGKWTE